MYKITINTTYLKKNKHHAINTTDISRHNYFINNTNIIPDCNFITILLSTYNNLGGAAPKKIIF